MRATPKRAYERLACRFSSMQRRSTIVLAELVIRYWVEARTVSQRGHSLIERRETKMKGPDG